MAYSFLPCDRDQAFLMPESLRDWLPEEDQVWFLIDTVSQMDLSVFHTRRSLRPRPEARPAQDQRLFDRCEPGAPGPRRADPRGRASYDPTMMVTLLLHAYSNGVRSSRQIERCLRRNADYRIITANQVVDHATISRFRASFEDEIEVLFDEVLELCAEAGLVSLGVIALDGTKIAGAAAMDANRSRAAIEAEVRRILREAADADAAEDAAYGNAAGDELPAGLADRKSRLANLDKARSRQLAKRRAAREAEAAAEAPKTERAKQTARNQPGARPRRNTKRVLSVARAEAELEIARAQAEHLAARRAAIEAEAAAKGRKPPGCKPDFTRRIAQAEAELQRAKAKEAEEESADVVNVTDPDSQMMNTRKGFLQGYNAQAVVNENQIILAADVTQDHNDLGQFVPMIEQAQTNLARARVTEAIGVVLADAGYLSDANLAAEGPQRLIAPTRGWKLRQCLEEAGYREGPAPGDATALEAMEHRLLTREGSTTYAKRAKTVEAVFGQIKEGLGLRRFSRRGLSAVRSEWLLVAVAHNLLKLFRHGPKPAVAIG